MSVIKVIEVLSSSDKSWEEAAQKAVSDASKSLRGIKSINVKNFSAVVNDGKITEFRLNGKITFEVEN
ncbi:MAG: dodecin family protein [Ignavibacteria bacterium]